MIEEATKTQGASAAASLARGVTIGLIGVAAIAIWAINLEYVFSRDLGDSALSKALRIILCDAVPVAVLCAIYRGIGQNKNLEGIVRGILRTVFWFCGGFLRPRPEQFSDEL